MIHISLKKQNPKKHINITDIMASNAGRLAVKQYGANLVLYLTFITSAIESSNDHTAVNSSSGALGAFQFLKSTVRRYKAAFPSLPTWSNSDPDVQLEYFLTALPSYMKQARRTYNAFNRRGLIKGVKDDPIAKLIVGFRLAYHVWAIANYDKSRSTQHDVNAELKPLVYAANQFVDKSNELFASRMPIMMTRTTFNNQSWI